MINLMPIVSYRDLEVWQKAMDLVAAVYAVAGQFPREELYGLVAQMKRAAVSIPSNIAEGHRRASRRQYVYFLNIAFGSGAELETQIEVAKRTEWGRGLDFATIDGYLNEVMRMLNVLIRKLAA